VGVAVRGLHVEHALGDLKDRDVEGAAPEVEDQDGLLGLLVEAIGQRRGGGLGNQAQNLEARDLAGFATSPTRISPDLVNATTDGVVRWPSALGMTTDSPPSRTLTTELVVPRSIPTAFGIRVSFPFCLLVVREHQRSAPVGYSRP
jgi:hypothetical protein